MEWQPIDDRYEVSSDGQVRSVGGVTLKQWLNDQGYAYVRLSGPRRQKRVHRLVAEAFIPNPEGKPCVNHINNCRSDNRVSNLEWCTQWENIDHAQKQGRAQRDYWIGRRSPNAKLSDAQVLAIRTSYAEGGKSLQTLANLYCVNKRTIGRIVKGESYV